MLSALSLEVTTFSTPSFLFLPNRAATRSSAFFCVFVREGEVVIVLSEVVPFPLHFNNLRS